MSFGATTPSPSPTRSPSFTGALDAAGLAGGGSATDTSVGMGSCPVFFPASATDTLSGAPRAGSGAFSTAFSAGFSAVFSAPFGTSAPFGGSSGLLGERVRPDGGAPFSVFETGAILIYLAEKSGRLLSADFRERHSLPCDGCSEAPPARHGHERITAHMDFVAVIPARYASTRLPGKALLDIAGKPMVVHVAERAQASGAVEVWVATDDERVLEAVSKHGHRCLMTAVVHSSGTDRIAEVAAKCGWPDETIVVNVQGDEPLFEPEVSDRAVTEARDSNAEITTLMTRLADAAAIRDPNRVKVVSDKNGFALYFSRSPIPSNGTTFLHLGLYVYRAEFLRKFTGLPPTPLELSERLEQLRVLEHGFRIRVVEVESASWGIDTRQDLERFNAVLNGAYIHG
jgi:3-deoxy-manno-octulosonate cytidylyltransferase (CMP-KDO synthetase)